MITPAATTPMTAVDGRHLYAAFLAGGERMARDWQLLNRINVFPVADGDTGSNLRATVHHILDTVRPHRSFQRTAARIAAAALEGARGNSGIIFAQFLFGLSREVAPEAGTVSVPAFARAMKRSVPYLYQAIENPVEGTVITVIREWAERMEHLQEKVDDFLHLLGEALHTARRSLAETTNRLKALEQARVVDAGAQAFIYFLEGVSDLIAGRNVRRLARPNRSAEAEPAMETGGQPEADGRYCSELLLEGADLERGEVRRRLRGLGDSLVIAGSGERLRVHVHTSRPALMTERLRDLGVIRRPKVDDMLRQYRAVHERRRPIALVTDSSCDLPQEVLDEHDIHVVPIQIHLAASTYLDRLTITPDQFYDLLARTPGPASTSQPNPHAFRRLFGFLAAHYDSVIAVHLSRHLSGTWSASRRAAEETMRETATRISVVDSGHLSGSLGLIVRRAAQAIAAGWDHEAILAGLQRWRSGARILVSVRDLAYMIRGGRVSPLKGRIATLLHLKPIVSLDEEGRSLLIGKAFSQRGNMAKVLAMTRRLLAGRSLHSYSVIHAHDPDLAAWYGDRLRALLQRPADFTLDLSPVIGMHAGPGAVAVAWLTE